jgi:hypothetical protein
MRPKWHASVHWTNYSRTFHGSYPEQSDSEILKCLYVQFVSSLPLP